MKHISLITLLDVIPLQMTTTVASKGQYVGRQAQEMTTWWGSLMYGTKGTCGCGLWVIISREQEYWVH